MRRLRLPETFQGQVFLCTLVSAVVLFPYLAQHGLNGVSRTYLSAALRFWSGANPYDLPVPNTDWFKYSPAFAMLYGALAYLPETLHALLWAALNFSVYWLGIARWVPAYRDGRALWFWLIAASMELDGSIRYQQINALMTGMILWGVADYRDGKYAGSGTWLTVMSNWKVLPAPFVIGLSRELRKPFWIALAVSSAALYVLPALVRGWSGNWDLHADWWALLRKDAASGGLLDLESVLSAYIPREAAHWARLMVGGVTFALLWDPRRTALFKPAETLWLCLGLTGILLFNPRTEPPTFVLAAPAMPMLWIASRMVGGNEKRIVRFVILVCFFFLSLAHNDIWPKAILDVRSWYNVDKTFAVLGLWLVSIYLGLRRS
jgi:hypothetical protein